MKKLSRGYIYFGFSGISWHGLQSLSPIVSNYTLQYSVATTPWILPPLASLTTGLRLDQIEVHSTNMGQKHSWQV